MSSSSPSDPRVSSNAQEAKDLPAVGEKALEVARRTDDDNFLKPVIKSYENGINNALALPTDIFGHREEEPRGPQDHKRADALAQELKDVLIRYTEQREPIAEIYRHHMRGASRGEDPVMFSLVREISAGAKDATYKAHPDINKDIEAWMKKVGKSAGDPEEGILKAAQALRKGREIFTGSERTLFEQEVKRAMDREVMQYTEKTGIWNERVAGLMQHPDVAALNEFTREDRFSALTGGRDPFDVINGKLPTSGKYSAALASAREEKSKPITAIMEDSKNAASAALPYLTAEDGDSMPKRPPRGGGNRSR